MDMRETAEHTRMMFSEELVQARLARDGLDNLALSAYNRTLADIAAVQKALDLTEDEAKDYLRASIRKPKN